MIIARNRSRGHLDRGLLPPAKAFYEAEGFKLARANSKGWCHAVGQPPCHHSQSGKSFSVNVITGSWRCFGCDQHGDQISFVRLRDGCGFLAACRTLGLLRGGLNREVKTRQREREYFRRAEIAAWDEAERRARLDARDRLHGLQKVYRFVDSRLTLDMDTTGQELYRAFLADLGDEIHHADAEYCALAGLEYLE